MENKSLIQMGAFITIALLYTLCCIAYILYYI